MVPWLLCALLGGWGLYLLGRLYCLHRAMEALAGQLTDWLDRDTNTLLTLSLSRDPYVRRLTSQLNGQLRRLRRQRRRYQNGDRELKEAVTNLSHDLRTPLTAICGYLELLEQTEQSSVAARYLAQIQNQVERMKQLTEELFRYSLLSTAQPLERADVMLNQVLEESLLAHHGALTQRNIVPDLDLTTVPVRRQLDQGALSRVFANILSNVLKYSEGDLAVRLTSEGEITFFNAASGLTPVMAGRLFDRFYTVESGRHATGLGLTIAKHLTEAMGGRIRADCRGGRLTIALSFPAEPSKREGASCSTPYFCDTM